MLNKDQLNSFLNVFLPLISRRLKQKMAGPIFSMLRMSCIGDITSASVRRTSAPKQMSQTHHQAGVLDFLACNVQF